MKWAILGLVLASAAQADQRPIWPQLHDVINVAPDDRLNIRQSPNAAAPIIGALAPDAKQIELVARGANSVWAQINVDERAGWVNTRFLKPTTDARMRPAKIQCYGTEPFWSFQSIDAKTYQFTSPETAPANMQQTRAAASQNHPFRHLIAGQGANATFSANLRAEQCSDGMSDRIYGMSIDIDISIGTSASFLSGCCSIQP